MKIGVISDTHGSLDAWKKARKGLFSDIDILIHAGDILNHGPFNPLPKGYSPKELGEELNSLDIPVIASRGNCDCTCDTLIVKFPIQSPYAFLQTDSCRILVNHGDELTEQDMVGLAKNWGVNIFISGHTHRPKLAYDGDVVLLNPGSPALPKGEPTVGIIFVEDNEIEIKVYHLETEEVLLE